jgi:hypothetical protein
MQDRWKQALLPIINAVIFVVLYVGAWAIETWLATPNWFGAILLIPVGLFVIWATEPAKQAVYDLLFFWHGWRLFCS